MTKAKENNNEVKVSKITIKVEGQEIDVTPEGAEKLYDALKGMFDKTTAVPTWPVPIIVREPYYPRPYWEWPYHTPSVTYDNNSSDNVVMSYSNDNVIEDIHV